MVTFSRSCIKENETPTGMKIKHVPFEFKNLVKVHKVHEVNIVGGCL